MNINGKSSIQFDNKIWLIIVLSLVIIITFSIIYHITKINNIEKEITIKEIEKIQELTPLIDSTRGDVVITLKKLSESRDRIDLIEEEMKVLRVDTISYDDAVKLIKRRRIENENLDIFGNPPGFTH